MRIALPLAQALEDSNSYESGDSAMKSVVAAVLVAVLAAGVLAPASQARAQVFDPYIVGMMAGPVSDGPSILLLKKREQHFLDPDTLAIACGAGAVSGVVAHAIPAFAMAVAVAGIGLPPLATVGGTMAFGCLVGTGAGGAAMGTQVAINQMRSAKVHRVSQEYGSQPRQESERYRPEPERSRPPESGFISIDTVIIGCVAGAAAGALTIILPEFAGLAAGTIRILPREVVATAGIGCAVGVVSGVAAIATALGLDSLRAMLASEP